VASHPHFGEGVRLLPRQVDGDKLWLAVRWLRNLLYRTEFCPERVKATAQKLLGDVNGYKRDGPSICSALMRVRGRGAVMRLSVSGVSFLHDGDLVLISRGSVDVEPLRTSRFFY
jgi:hypothetical protein